MWKLNNSKSLIDGETILCIDESPCRYVPVMTQRWVKEGLYPIISLVRSDWQRSLRSVQSHSGLVKLMYSK